MFEYGHDPAASTAFVTGVLSRRIVGRRTASSMPTALPLDALERIWARQRAGHTNYAGPPHQPVQHADVRVESTATGYAERLADAGAVASIGSVGDSYDNASAESVIRPHMTQSVRRDGPFRTTDDPELTTLAWVDRFNEQRLHRAPVVLGLVRLSLGLELSVGLATIAL